MRDDWAGLAIGDICTFTGGGTPSKKNPDYWDGKIPWASVKDIKGSRLTETKNFITLKGIKGSATNVAEKGQLILATRIIPGRPIITQIKTTINQDLKIVQTGSNIITSFLFYFFLLNEKRIKDLSSGTTVLGINLNILKELSILIPSLPEQKGIVAKIEQMFSELDKGIAALKQAKEKLDVYRQSVLKKAFEGELTRAWREKQADLPTAEKLVEQFIANNRIPYGWSLCKLRHLIERPKYGTPKKCTYNRKPDSKGVIRIPNIANFHIDENDMKYGEFSVEEICSYSLRAGDILTIRSNGSVDLVGKCAVVHQGSTDYLYAGYLIRLRPLADVINPFYLLYCMSSHYLRVQIENRAKSTSGVNNINSNELSSLVIPYCSIEEQKQIVREIETRLASCDQLEESIDKSLKKAEALRHSILKKAFEGKLLSEEELAACRAEPDYCPAAELVKKARKKIKPAVSEKKKISSDRHAGVIAKIIKLHEDNPDYLDRLSHIKCEKISHLVEYYLQIPLGRTPVKDAAGPDDYPHLKQVEFRAKMTGYFMAVPLDIGRTYKSGKNIQKVIDKLHSELSYEQNKSLDELISLFLPHNLEQAEIAATLYAAWNNLIILGCSINDESIVYEARENWSTRKMKIKRERFFKGLEWLRQKELIPTGYGNVVSKPRQKPKKKK